MIIGIDLGTTNSLVAVLYEEGPKIIPNRLGKMLTPSVVSVDEEGNILVGETAKERMSLYPDTVASTFKRSMGTEREYILSGKKYLPEELSAMVIRSLKEDAETFLGEEVTEAVISVPAYFDDQRKKATKRAGEIAGLKVERMISEPTAAAVSHGLYDQKGNCRFLVFDLGGGTFDISIFELFDNILEVKSVAGDNYLGGEDFTKVLEDIFLKDQGIKKEELKQKDRVRLYKAAEKAKCSFEEQNEVVLEFLYENKQLKTTIKKDYYEKSCEELFEKIREPIKRSIKDARISLDDIDKIVLVGGATRLSIVREFIVRVFHKFPDTSTNPDEAVAAGAAIEAAMKERMACVKEIIMTDVCSFTLGTEVVMEYENGQMESGHFCPIIERNTVIPVSRTERLYTIRDNQDKIRVKVYQGESRYTKNNQYLGELTVDIPKSKKEEQSVDVTYTYDINSLLEVMVKVTSTDEVKKIIIKGRLNNMTEEEIAQRMEELSYLKIQPRDQEENRLLLLQAERIYEESLGDIRKQLELKIQKFEEVLKQEDKKRIEEAAKELQCYLNENFL